MFEIKLKNSDETNKVVTVPETKNKTVKAYARLRMKEETLQRLLSLQLQKGDVLVTAKIAGIMAAKRAWELIPLCRNNSIEKTEIEFSDNGIDELYIYADTVSSGKIKIDMEAMTAVSIAALTVYDMCKETDKSVIIEEIKLLEKML